MESILETKPLASKTLPAYGEEKIEYANRHGHMSWPQHTEGGVSISCSSYPRCHSPLPEQETEGLRALQTQVSQGSNMGLESDLPATELTVVATAATQSFH